MTPAPSPFAVLGVPHDVDDAALKKAYFRKLREHPPETDPEKFQAVQDAFEVLRDPAGRREAAAPQVPPRVKELMRSALTAPDAKLALARLEKAIAEFPDYVPARVMHASVLAHLEPEKGLAAARELATKHPRELEALLLLAELEKGEGRRAAYARAREAAPEDRRPLYGDAKELIDLKRFDEALAALDAAAQVKDARYVSDMQLAGRRLLTRMERGEPLANELATATPELAPMLVTLAATMIDTHRNVYAQALLDKVHALQPERQAIPFGPARHIPLAQLPEATRAAVERNAHTPSRQTVQITAPPSSKKWVAKPVWWVELRRLHLVVRRSTGVQVCPLLSLHLQQREADVPLMTCYGNDAGLGGMTELAVLFEAVMARKRRLLDLMSKDLIETELQLEPLTWTLSSNA